MQPLLLKTGDEEKRGKEMSTNVQQTFAFIETDLSIRQITPRQWDIIKCLTEDKYQAQIARELFLSSAYVCRFMRKLKEKDLIAIKFIDPLEHRATSYTVSKLLTNRMQVESGNTRERQFLFVPHNVRYKHKITSQNKPIDIYISSFKASKFKHIKSWETWGIQHHKFEMRVLGIGNIVILVHSDKTIEVMQGKERYKITAKSKQDADNKVTVILQDGLKEFIRDQARCKVDITVGEMVLGTNPHYAQKSMEAKYLVENGQGQTTLDNEFEPDGSRMDEKEIKKEGELETRYGDAAQALSDGIHIARNLDTIVPNLVKTAMEAGLPPMIQAAINPLHVDFQNLTAHISAGNTNQYQFNQIVGMFAQTKMADNARFAKLEKENQELKEMLNKILAGK